VQGSNFAKQYSEKFIYYWRERMRFHPLTAEAELTMTPRRTRSLKPQQVAPCGFD
jgi:hypothetical protein